jgi:hypothetical protein
MRRRCKPLPASYGFVANPSGHLNSELIAFTATKRLDLGGYCRQTHLPLGIWRDDLRTFGRRRQNCFRRTQHVGEAAFAGVQVRPYELANQESAVRMC